MTKFDTYKNAFPHAGLTRSPEGILEVVLHTDRNTLVFDGHTHEEFEDLFHRISEDADSRVVILTGAGEAFIDQIDPTGSLRGGATPIAPNSARQPPALHLPSRTKSSFWQRHK